MCCGPEKNWPATPKKTGQVPQGERLTRIGLPDKAK